MSPILENSVRRGVGRSESYVKPGVVLGVLQCASEFVIFQFCCRTRCDFMKPAGWATLASSMSKSCAFNLRTMMPCIYWG